MATRRVPTKASTKRVPTKPARSKGRERHAASRSGASSAAARRSKPTIFISYRHSSPSTEIARKLFSALVPAAETWDAGVFMDSSALEPADLFDQKILAALDRTTHFIVLLTNSYWGSDYCRKELARAVERFEQGEQARLLFVKVEELDPGNFTFAKDRASGRIRSDSPLVSRIGDVQFLGPFDEVGHLVRLQWEHEAQLGDQLAQLVNRLRLVVE